MPEKSNYKQKKHLWRTCSFRRTACVTFLIHVTSKVYGVGEYSENWWGGGVYSGWQYLHCTEPALRWNKLFLTHFYPAFIACMHIFLSVLGKVGGSNCSAELTASSKYTQVIKLNVEVRIDRSHQLFKELSAFWIWPHVKIVILLWSFRCLNKVLCKYKKWYSMGDADILEYDTSRCILYHSDNKMRICMV